MGMFSRMSDIVQANVNAILDKAEDPVKMVKLLIQEMEETLVELRGAAAVHLAEKRQIEGQLREYQTQTANWTEKAQVALQKDREDLARLALSEKQKAQQKQQAIHQELAVVDESLNKLKSDTERLQNKLFEAKTKQQSLLTRERSASVRMQAKQNLHAQKIDDAVIKFEQFERKIDDLEAQVDAHDFIQKNDSVSAQLDDLVAQDQIEQELKALKEKVA